MSSSANRKQYNSLKCITRDKNRGSIGSAPVYFLIVLLNEVECPLIAQHKIIFNMLASSSLESSARNNPDNNFSGSWGSEAYIFQLISSVQPLTIFTQFLTVKFNEAYNELKHSTLFLHSCNLR